MRLHWSVIAVLITLFPLASAQADPAGPPFVLAPGQKFVQDFYDWYAPSARAEKVGAPWMIALKEKSAYFDAKLAAALTEDNAAQAKVSDDIVGLDFDPFINSQDTPADRYVVGAARWKGNTLRVDVYSITSGKKSDKPDVVDELVITQGQFQFVNFDYPDGDNLVSTLATLKADREKR
ncbi:MAG: hypothetical protein WAW96_11950 [Alphaproteobacteria bacterium]